MIYLLTQIILVIIVKSIFQTNPFFIFLIIAKFCILLILLVYYYHFLNRKDQKYDYQRRGIRGLSLSLIMIFGLSIGIFLVFIGTYSVKVASIDNYVKNHKSGVIHFSEY